MKNALIAVGSVVGFILIVLWFTGSSSTPTVSADIAATAERVVTEMQQNGLIGKIDESLSYVYVQPSRWAALTIDEKRTVAKACAIHFKQRGQTGYAHIYDHLSGKRLARMTSGWSFDPE